jgi:uncharacterized protein YfbU (UPF0304 family)
MEKKKMKKIVKLNKDFYHKEVINKAISDFNDLLDVKILDQSYTLEISVLNSDKEFSKISNEFCNYVLGVMKNNALV